LAEALLARQAEVAFVDADIGQSNLGPPTAVTLGYPTPPVDFSTVPAAAYYFVGSTGPIGRFLPLVIGTATLAREVRGAFVIIDTTGLVHGSPSNLERSRASRSSTKTRSASSRRCTRLGSMVMPIPTIRSVSGALSVSIAEQLSSRKDRVMAKEIDRKFLVKTALWRAMTAECSIGRVICRRSIRCRAG